MVFVWVQVQDLFIYSCYISPNTHKLIFEEYVHNLSEDILTKRRAKIVLTGDFNSKSPMWGSLIEDDRGTTLSTMLCALGMIPLNKWDAGTFVRGDYASAIDISAISEELALSPHRYIVFGVNQKTYAGTGDKWVHGPLDKAKMADALVSLTSQNSAATPGRLRDVLKEAYNKTTPKVTRDGRVPYWWTSEIADLRRVGVCVILPLPR